MQGTVGSITRLTALTCAVLFAFLGTSASASAAAPQIPSVGVSAVSATSAVLEAKVNPEGKATRYHFEYGLASCASNPCTSTPQPEGSIVAGTSPVLVEASLEGLSPGTVYHFRVVAKNGDGKTTGTDRVFATFSAPATGLPDGRAYEQATPVDKDGGDAAGKFAIVKAAEDGSAITFGSTFGIPGGVGAQRLPLYLARRGSAEWSTRGLLPPADTGQQALTLGWLPDFSEVFSNATKLGDPRTKAMLGQATDGSAPFEISPYVPNADYGYVGATEDGSTVLFESEAPLPPEEGQPPIPAALKGLPNVYAWSRATGKLALADVLNDGTVPAGGATAGSSNPRDYRQDEHVVTGDGSVFFTARGTGQLYLRLNPTQAQSPLDGEGKCEDSSLACTIHVSASQKTNGKGPGGTDPAGAQPATFQAATPDGSEAFFTSSEMLTNDAKTGPEQPLASIGISGIEGGIEDAELIKAQHAIGLAVDGSHLYWADPTSGTIGRSNLDGSEVNPAFIVPPSVEFEFEVEIGEGEFETRKETVPSKPRYLAVAGEYVYWTNSGRLKPNGEPAEEGGTIGRAKLNGSTVEEVKPAFIRGASNPQGIAVDSEHIYWANAAHDPAQRRISRAGIGGSGVESSFVKPDVTRTPYGVSLSGDHLYFAAEEVENNHAYVESAPLAGGPLDGAVFVGNAGVRGVSVQGSHVYWASLSEEEVGRADLKLENPEKGLVRPGGGVGGIATDAAHIYWALNGEAPTNPGTDLYRYLPATGQLTDLTPDPTDTNGAEVQGVLGTSLDGSEVYFAANGVLAKGANLGTCHGKGAAFEGSCSLYAWHEGQIGFVAQLSPTVNQTSDGINWVQTPIELFGNGSYVAKTSSVSRDGQTLVFRTQEQLSEYDNEGVPEFYRYRAGAPQPLVCLTCNPSGEAPGAGPDLGSIKFPSLGPLSEIAQQSRNMSADGDRFFFETPEALSPADTNGQGGCPSVGGPAQRGPACMDVYEWEAPESGSCKPTSPSYSPLNGGCLYLISTGKSSFPSLFGDASASGDDVFFFTRQGLVGQDGDELQDVYDAKVEGGLPSQNPPPAIPCESAEACHGPASVPPGEPSPGSASFVGPGNPAPEHTKPKHKKKHKAKKHHKKKKANAKGRVGR